jgi:hypothetical protein
MGAMARCGLLGSFNLRNESPGVLSRATARTSSHDIKAGLGYFVLGVGSWGLMLHCLRPCIINWKVHDRDLGFEGADVFIVEMGSSNDCSVSIGFR